MRIVESDYWEHSFYWWKNRCKYELCVCVIHSLGYKREHRLANSSFDSEMTYMLQHPFTTVVAGPTGCGKSQFVLRLIDNAREMTEPAPSRIWCSYGDCQPIFNNYLQVYFHEGLPQFSNVRNKRVSRKHVYETITPEEHERSISYSKRVRQEQVRKND